MMMENLKSNKLQFCPKFPWKENPFIAHSDHHITAEKNPREIKIDMMCVMGRQKVTRHDDEDKGG
jgi:hypothetical protein